MKHNIISVSLVSCVLLLPGTALASAQKGDDLPAEFMRVFGNLQAEFCSFQSECDEKTNKIRQELKSLRKTEGVDSTLIKSSEARLRATEETNNQTIKKVQNAMAVLNASGFASLAPGVRQISSTFSKQGDK